MKKIILIVLMAVILSSCSKAAEPNEPAKPTENKKVVEKENIPDAASAEETKEEKGEKDKTDKKDEKNETSNKTKEEKVNREPERKETIMIEGTEEAINTKLYTNKKDGYSIYYDSELKIQGDNKIISADGNNSLEIKKETGTKEESIKNAVKALEGAGWYVEKSSNDSFAIDTEDGHKVEFQFFAQKDDMVKGYWVLENSSAMYVFIIEGQIEAMEGTGRRFENIIGSFVMD